jgi:XRE family aerobic/anaerobic benzoate catabolism transcriptional regulator
MADHPEAMAELRRLLATRDPLYARAENTVDTSRLGVDGTLRAVEALVTARNASADHRG